MNRTTTRNEYMRILQEEQELLGSGASTDTGSQINPSIQTIRNILSFSRSYSHRESNLVGCIEHVLN